MQYYDDNIDQFCKETMELDMGALYEPFEQSLGGGSILDAGCGCGRDSLYFSRRGYQVTAIDSSEKMCERVARYGNIDVHNINIVELEDLETSFDGIWCCASLLHFNIDVLPNVLRMLSRCLNPNGILYVSFKEGTGDTWNGERYFSNMDDNRFRRIVSGIPTLQTTKSWITPDTRPHKERNWFNALLQLDPVTSIEIEYKKHLNQYSNPEALDFLYDKLWHLLENAEREAVSRYLLQLESLELPSFFRDYCERIVCAYTSSHKKG